MRARGDEVVALRRRQWGCRKRRDVGGGKRETSEWLTLGYICNRASGCPVPAPRVFSLTICNLGLATEKSSLTIFFMRKKHLGSRVFKRLLYGPVYVACVRNYGEVRHKVNVSLMTAYLGVKCKKYM